jgi:transposase
MNNRQNKTQNDDPLDLMQFFTNPQTTRQKQYEAVRALVVEKMSVEQVCKKFNYKVNTVYALIRDAKSGKIALFPEVKKGPAQRRTSPKIQEKIILSRKRNNLSSPDIRRGLSEEGIKVSTRTIERILKDAGFAKLKRRTHKELGISKKNKIIPLRSEHLDMSTLKPFQLDVPVAGVFFFLPYVIESGLTNIIKKCQLPQSSKIAGIQACLSMLVLKLIGNQRLSHMDSYDCEPGLGIWAGLNVLPKSTYMSTYSCRSSEAMLVQFQKDIIEHFKKIYPEFYGSDFINLDFHSIPHYGEEAEMEKVWCGARGKALTGANTIFAQDSLSHAIMYTRADILRKEESQEVKKFVAYWKEIKGGVENIDETLVFDCKFTKQSILDELAQEKIKFITLRKRNQKLIRETEKIPAEKWKKVKIKVPKRKFKNIRVYENEAELTGCTRRFRQIIIKQNGRENPTYVITNDAELLKQKIVEVYAKRWGIENKLAELVAFFNLNALSSPLMIRIHFDVLWTMIADTLYHRLAKDLRRFEAQLAPAIFRKFINMPGKIAYDGKKFILKIRKRAHTPVLMGVEKLEKPFPVPWLNNTTIEIRWTA